MATRPQPKKSARKPNRVDKVRALDRGIATKQPGQAQAARGRFPAQPGAPIQQPQGQPQGGAPQAGAPQAQQVGQHPFIPGANLAPVVPANASQPGSPPGTPNLGSMVMRSFQPHVLERTPLVSAGAGVPPQGGQPNQQFNFGGANTAPPGTRSMRQGQPQQPGQQPTGGAY